MIIVMDFILNHISVLSSQFQDIIKNGEQSKYKDFFMVTISGMLSENYNSDIKSKTVELSKYEELIEIDRQELDVYKDEQKKYDEVINIAKEVLGADLFEKNKDNILIKYINEETYFMNSFGKYGDKLYDKKADHRYRSDQGNR